MYWCVTMWRGCYNSIIMGFVTGFILVSLAFKMHPATFGPLHSFYLDLEAVGPPSHFNYREPVTSQSETSVNHSLNVIPNLHCSNSTIK